MLIPTPPPNSTWHFLHRLWLGREVLEGKSSLRTFLLRDTPLTLSQSESISLPFSGILGTSILSLIMAFPISQLGSPTVPDTESFIGSVLFLSVTSLQSQSTISVCSNELAPSGPQICPLLGLPLQSKESSPQAKSFTDKGEKAIQSHRHLQRLTVGVVAGRTATSHMGRLCCMTE